MPEDEKTATPVATSTTSHADASRIDREPERTPVAPLVKEATNAKDAQASDTSNAPQKSSSKTVTVEVEPVTVEVAPAPSSLPAGGTKAVWISDAATTPEDSGSKEANKDEVRLPSKDVSDERLTVKSDVKPKHKGFASRARQALLRSSWYHSPAANALRNVVTSKTFAGVGLWGLFLALFLPDLWIIIGIDNNLIIDLILTTVMLVFTFELFSLSSVDAGYILSFFFFMDILGTVSMIFDISYLAGSGHEDVNRVDGSDKTQHQAMLLRATRAAKVGARAGRISRLVRFLRFIPFLAKGVAPPEQSLDEKGGIAAMISAQLANLLATRVACLTITLIMVIPLFDVLTFPQQDLSLQTWTERLSVLCVTAESSRTASSWSVLERELRLMAEFFERGEDKFGPYKVCVGRDEEDTFVCAQDQPQVIRDWKPLLGAPPRGASNLAVNTNRLMIVFNMHNPTQLEAGLSMATNLFVIFIMVFSGLALSSVVNDLAVRPLNRMLSTVMEIASTVFKLGTEVATEEFDENEEVEIDTSNEMKLLEKVVQKLAVIADLQTRSKINATEDMQDEDLGVLGIMQGTAVKQEEQNGRRPSTVQSPRSKKQIGLNVKLEEYGLTQEFYTSSAFSPLDLTKAQRCAIGVYTICTFSETGEGFVTTLEEQNRLQRFVAAVEREYPQNPFHNFSHAVDVVHCVARMMKLIDTNAFLSELDQYSLLIAAIAHDLGHPGVNNGFLAEVGHELALQYNDKSPLENMHCAKLYTIVAVADTNVFAKMTKEQYREARKNCIETILHTDMVGHQGMVKDLQMLYQMNAEVFESPPDLTRGNSSAELQVFAEADNKMLAMECLLHSADVSNPCRPWEVTQAWAMRCLEEFFAQGDQEKQLNIPVQFLNDREKLNKPNSQIGFIEFMIAPFFVVQIRLWPKLHEYGDNMTNNISRWAELWEQEVSPGEEEKAKVKSRVERVAQNVEDAKIRATA